MAEANVVYTALGAGVGITETTVIKRDVGTERAFVLFILHDGLSAWL